MAYYDEDCDVVFGQILPDVELAVRFGDLGLAGSKELDLEIDGEYLEFPTAWVPELMATLAEAYLRATGEEAPIAANQRRYLQLRSADIEAIQKGGIFAGITPDNVVVNGEDLDQALDAVRDQEVLS